MPNRSRINMEFENIIKYITGENGGIFALGLISGGLLAMRYIAPRVYGPRIVSLETTVSQLVKDFEPYREWQENLVEKNLPKT